MTVVEMPPPHSRMCWSMRCPRRRRTTCGCPRSGRGRSTGRRRPGACRRSPRPAGRPCRTARTDSGSISQSDDHEAATGVGPTAARPAGRHRRAGRGDRRGLARRPSGRRRRTGRARRRSPSRIRPARGRRGRRLSSWSRSSMSPLRADIDSVRRCITRASAYRAPAAMAASTAAVAASNSVMCPTLCRRPSRPTEKVRGGGRLERASGEGLPRMPHVDYFRCNLLT